MNRQELNDKIANLIEGWTRDKGCLIGDVVDDILMYVDQYRETIDKIIEKRIGKV